MSETSHMPADPEKAGPERPRLQLHTGQRVEEPTPRNVWDIEYDREVWRLRELGIRARIAHILFDRIPQPWLKDLAKRWARWRLSTGLGAESAASGTRAITHFAQFLASPAVRVVRLDQVDRPLLERYLAHLHADYAGRVVHRNFMGQLNLFFLAIRQHRWNDTLPASTVFFPEDFPRYDERLPRALSEPVMTQLEQPSNLDRWKTPAYRLVTLILMRCGLRITDTVRLPHDCIVHDADSAPYLRYLNHKMKREALVPIDEELEREIRDHQRHLRDRWPHGTPVLFPRSLKNADGHEPTDDNVYRRAMHQWLKACDVRDEHGRLVKVTPHQFRHTLGTRLINRDVPQEVVRRILDHDSHMMTAHYARLSDTTIRRHWEQARKVDVTGQTVALDPEGPLAEASWAKQRLGRVTQALPNGFCGLPVQKSCPHANACLTCPMFVTTPEFLPQHRQQRQQLLQIVSAAEARGQLRVVEMNQQALGSLDRIITALEEDEAPGGAEVADAG
ncbi:tyrosine-type recombinase/integrase [Streptomyces sp. NBC_01207]|uniref:tyrosine-type recombinase/integrase n=1 Tax=Streptomyces sp. NBC_01207 TaxID=2903772 RepID=UPI002E0EED18|nr:site-specific integrase [Streptomyces sp. NBC_01207]